MWLKLLLVAASVLLSSLAARRFGHAVGGTLGGLPMIAGPIAGFVLLAAPVQEVRGIASATLVCLPATVAHLLTFAWTSVRGPWWLGLLLANAAFFSAGLALPLLQMPAWSSPPLALLALVLGQALMPRLHVRPAPVAISPLELACRVLAAMLVAWLIVRSAGLAPAAWIGLLLAVPIPGSVWPAFTLPRHGAAATAALIRGFLRGLFGFVAFFSTLGAMLERTGALTAYVSAWGAALLVAIGLYLWQERRARRA
jgi:hypothetical protein